MIMSAFLASFFTIYFLIWAILIIVGCLKVLDTDEFNNKEKEESALFLLTCIFLGPIILLTLAPFAIMSIISSFKIVFSSRRSLKEMLKTIFG